VPPRTPAAGVREKLMARQDARREELDRLRAELAAAGQAGSDLSATDEQPEQRDGQPYDYAELLTELQDRFADAVDDLEDVVTSHPLAAMAVALVAGIAIGRRLGRH
jgi:ElaB/YqjD/DUF883 family membrane-anchored ribosome-binding protein